MSWGHRTGRIIERIASSYQLCVRPPGRSARASLRRTDARPQRRQRAPRFRKFRVFAMRRARGRGARQSARNAERPPERNRKVPARAEHALGRPRGEAREARLRPGARTRLRTHQPPREELGGTERANELERRRGSRPRAALHPTDGLARGAEIRARCLRVCSILVWFVLCTSRAMAGE